MDLLETDIGKYIIWAIFLLIVLAGLFFMMKKFGVI